MEAKEFLKTRGLKNPAIDSGIGGGYFERTHVTDVMEEYHRQTPNKWIPVTVIPKPLFDSGERFIKRFILLADGTSTVGRYNLDFNEWVVAFPFNEKSNKVTHWFPIPEL